MTVAPTLILDRKQVLQKIKRIAYEIYEDNANEQEVILAGIYDKGFRFAQLLQEQLKSISPLAVHLVRIDLEKLSPVQSEIQLDCEESFLKDKSIVLLDDVLNTGRTLAHSLKPFLQIPVKKIRVAVIVNRSHTLFPIAADFVGYALSTTLQEHIDVNLDDSDQLGVYLS
ncbi:phosphoribosyltransferase family protein [Cytophagaceae bacterium DM2B3-1]|uniref:Phosphoribosyltransferase family protein n=1 Tax=Xanthocytophaga flava TaxID=3048013 RepID=A0ABT7CDX8_9BACT|nr:phosphoribosyltransferase family protein [Xanthocytophaga flavus]MDJ1491944.1 phosphoribosyltransferase family protein [Xanthocytophaga flavus]